ncbi:MAG: hypothetical protein JW780_03145 [Clostridiales bacterium]|nr:hypothetical protein [Clostridiales bacterium]
MDKRAQARLLFEEYNRYMEELGDDFLSRLSSSNDVYTDEFEQEFNIASEERSDAFFSEPLEGLATDTPADFIRSLSSIDECMEVFVIASEVSDVQPPRILTQHMQKFGEEAVERLRALALSEDWDKGDESDTLERRDRMASNLSAVLVLGKWRDEDSVRPILDHFSQSRMPDEYVSDIISEYAESMGEMIVGALRRILDSAESIRSGGPEESLMVALSKAGAKHRTDETYQTLRVAFRKAERKIIGALCLGDYGDPRAVKLLKGYLDRNNHRIDRELFYETLTVIRKLGGDISDINDPFGDFSHQ